MQLIYVTSKTKFTGIKNLDAIKKGQTIHATVLHEGKKYIATVHLRHVASSRPPLEHPQMSPAAARP